MTSIPTVFSQIASTSSRSNKEQLLEYLKMSDVNQEAQEVLVAALNPTVDYYIKKFPMPKIYFGNLTLIEAVRELDTLSSRRITGNAAKQWVNETLSRLSEEDADIFAKVIKKDLKCGFRANTVNKIWPDLIYQHPYMRCSGFSEKTLKNITFPCKTQTKMDGMYCDIIVNNDGVMYMSRQGTNLNLNMAERDHRLMALRKNYGNYVLQGEIMVESAGEDEARSDGNGYVNSDDRDLNRIHFVLWDIVDHNHFLMGKGNDDYDTRFAFLASFLYGDEHGGFEKYNITLVESRTCNNKEDIIDHFTAVREKGLEGIIIKDLTGMWKDGTSKHQIKVKVIIEVDLVITGWKFGKEGTKNATRLGTLIMQSSEGLCEVGCGGGMSDKERQDFLKEVDHWVDVGQIATIKTNGVVKSKDKDIYSLYLPRLKEIRFDKHEADSLERIQEQEASFTDALQLIGS